MLTNTSGDTHHRGGRKERIWRYPQKERLHLQGQCLKVKGETTRLPDGNAIRGAAWPLGGRGQAPAELCALTWGSPRLGLASSV